MTNVEDEVESETEALDDGHAHALDADQQFQTKAAKDPTVETYDHALGDGDSAFDGHPTNLKSMTKGGANLKQPQTGKDGRPVKDFLSSLPTSKTSKEEKQKPEKQTTGAKRRISSDAAATHPDLCAPGFFDNLKLEIDAVSVFLFITALSTRFYKLEEPRAIVFDEINFGKFASLYLKRVFFFDVHPPFGKMLIGLAGAYGGYDGDFNFEKIGAEYNASVPLWHLRFVPAFCGSLLVPLTYHLLLEVGCSSWTSSLGAILIILDNALLVQSHFILLEPILLCAMALSFISLLKFLKATSSSRLSFFWLVSTGVFVGLTTSVKYCGMYTWFMVLAALSWHFWRRHLPDASLSKRALFGRVFVLFFAIVAIPVAIYSGLMLFHVQWLTKAGPHDHIMTSGFQASLEGGLASIVQGQPPHIKFGSQITLRSTHGQPPCWLHSHKAVYPVNYEDGRGSSHQQQVTCYSFKDVNNWWIVKDPNSDSLLPSDAAPLKHGAVIQLIHGMSGRALNSHDVAAPLTPENQEVSCYIDYNVSMPTQNLWRLEVNDADTGGDAFWRPITAHVRLVHLGTNQALKSTSQVLPDWGFHQLEVSTDRVLKQNPTLWNVEEHRLTETIEERPSNPDDEDEERRRKQELVDADFIPEVQSRLDVWTKMYELQSKMITTIHDIPKEHRYGSSPSDWPLLDTTVGYWVSTDNHAQIHLVGNPLVWRAGVAAAVTYLVLLGLYSLLLHRGWIALPDDREGDGDKSHAGRSPSANWWSTFLSGGWLLLGGYLLHYIPYFVYDYTLFLHHYIPALYFKILLLAFVVDHLSMLLSRFRLLQHGLTLAIVVWIYFVVRTFKTLTPLTYGDTNLTATQLKKLQLNENWDFVFH